MFPALQFQLGRPRLSKLKQVQVHVTEQREERLLADASAPPHACVPAPPLVMPHREATPEQGPKASP